MSVNVSPKKAAPDWRVRDGLDPALVSDTILKSIIDFCSISNILVSMHLCAENKKVFMMRSHDAVHDANRVAATFVLV